MRLFTCLVLLIGVAGCASVGSWPAFHPAGYSADEIGGVPGGKLPFACDGCLEEGIESRICVGVHALQKAHYGGGRTPDGRPGVLVPVQLDYTNHDEASRLLRMKKVRLVIAGESIEPNVWYSDTGYNDFIPSGGSRTMRLGFVVAERLVRESSALRLECPCPGAASESLTFDFVVVEK